MTIYDNSPDLNCNESDPVWTDGSGSGNDPGARYISFTPSVDATITRITLNIFPSIFVFNGNMKCSVSLFADNGSNAPGATIALLSVVSGVFAFCGPAVMFDLGTLMATPTVNAGVRYWLGIVSDGDGHVTFSDTTNIGRAADSLGIGAPGEYHAALTIGALLVQANDTSNFPYVVTIEGASITLPRTYKFSGQVPVSAPAISADLRGIVMLIHAFLAGSTNVVFLYAHTSDIVNFTGWRVYLIWSWAADGGPPPPNLDIATDASAVFLSPDIMEVCCGRAFASITAKSSSFAGLQSMYLGTIDWSVAP